jgi:zinc protease
MTAAVPYAGLLDAVLPPDSVERATLANGLRLLVRRDPSAPVVAIVTYVKAGYFDETDDEVGISHVLEHMYFKGTPTRGPGEIARGTKASGGYLNAGTIYDHTHYYTVLPSNGFAAGLAIQADAFANSLLDGRELARELEVIIEEAKRKTDNADALATETLFALLYDRHRIRRWRMGREAGLRTFTREMVGAFYRKFYRPSNTVLAIVGDIDPARARALAEQHYGAIADAPVERSPAPVEPAHVDSSFRYTELSGDVQQAELLFGWRTPALLHDDTPPLDLLAAVLAAGRASRLYRAVRERRLASTITAYDYTPGDVGVFVVHATARAERARGAARAAWDQLRRVREGEIAAPEVERARRVLEAQWLRRFESMEGQANHLAAWELAGDWQLGGAYLDRLLAADAARLGDVARRWLAPERAGLVVYRPSDAPAFAADARDPRDLRDAFESERPEGLAPLARPTAPTPVHGSRGWVFEREEAQVRVYRTGGGVPVLVHRRAGALVHMGWFVRGGAVHEAPGAAGITSLMARASLKGTDRRSAQRVAEDAEFLGGVLAASATADAFQWTISVPRQRLEEAADLLGDVVQRPSFADEALESERAVALANVAALRDDMYRWPLRLATQAAWGSHPYGQSVLGTEESLAAIDAAATRRWHARHALEAPGVVVCVGEVGPDEAASLASRFFSGLRAADGGDVPVPVWPASVVSNQDRRDKAQSALAMLFDGPTRGDDARFGASMIAGVASGLGGRFFDELRDRQSLAYTVMASPMVRRRAGAFSAYIACSPEKEDAARRGLLAEFAKLREAPVTERELSQAKTYALGTWAIRRESAAAVMGDIADAWLFGRSLSELTEYESRVRAVSAAQMLQLARAHFNPDRRVEGVVRGTGRVV